MKCMKGKYANDIDIFIIQHMENSLNDQNGLNKMEILKGIKKVNQVIEGGW